MLVRTAPARSIRLTGLPLDADAARSVRPALMREQHDSLNSDGVASESTTRSRGEEIGSLATAKGEGSCPCRTTRVLQHCLFFRSLWPGTTISPEVPGRRLPPIWGKPHRRRQHSRWVRVLIQIAGVARAHRPCVQANRRPPGARHHVELGRIGKIQWWSKSAEPVWETCQL